MPGTRSAISRFFAIVIWFFQLVLAVVYGVAGISNATAADGPLIRIETAPNPEYFEILPRLMGAIDLLAAFGIIFPTVLASFPMVTMLAAITISIIQGCAVADDVWNADPDNMLAADFILLAFSLAVTCRHRKKIGPFIRLRTNIAQPMHDGSR
jgi:hypothetical protein